MTSFRWLKPKPIDAASVDALCRPFADGVWYQPAILLARIIRHYPAAVAVGITSFLAMAFAGVFAAGLLLPLISLIAGGGEPQSETATTILALFNRLGIQPNIVIFLGLILAASLLEICARAFHNLYLNALGESLRADFRKNIFNRLMWAPQSFLTGSRRGVIVGAIVQEAANTSKAYVQVLKFVGTGTVAIVYLALAAIVSWKFTAGACLVALATIFVARPLNKRARSTAKLTVSNNASLMEALNEHLAAAKLIKAMGMEDFSVRKLGDLIDASARFFVKSQSYPILLKLSIEAISISILSVALYVAVSVLALGIAEIIVLLAVFMRVMPQISELQQSYQFIVAGIPSYERLSELFAELNTFKSVPGSEEIKFSQSVVLDKVSLRLGDRQILDLASLTIQANKITVLVGPSGSGKSTIIDLITGVLQPDTGVVAVDGRPMGQINMALFRGDLALSPQDNTFFHDTIENNLKLFASDASPEEIWAALSMASADSFVRERVDGLQSVLGDGALRVSGGQRQRLSLARALLRRPRLLILDEPTSALDHETEVAVISALRAIKGDVTVFVVTHSNSFFEIADAVYEFTQAGAIRQRQPPAPLGGGGGGVT